ncbi:L,D-transpeptidase family protein [Comamonas composti]|uniref:L,D-transpeptidase family protein n=1 Tax=Comamonas composti TaxID=408558 RepID=UPI00041533BD|nr:L,D-transpeptidase family protein [Comamonas composti]
MPGHKALFKVPKNMQGLRPLRTHLLALGLVAGVAFSAQAAADAAQVDAEARLLGVLRLVEQRDLDGAIKAAGELTAQVPNFQAAQLVYADLLRFRMGQGRVAAPGFGASAVLRAEQAAGRGVLAAQLRPGSSTAGVEPMTLDEQLRGLQQELKRRVEASHQALPENAVPSDFLQLAASVKHAIAVDAGKSRLYLFANEGGVPRLLGNYYVTVGRLGLNKQKEGDQRTPEGIYFISRQLAGSRLPSFYGKGALTVNYPNDWDRYLGRTGSGIWLHGTPPEQFARLPMASDGCVVLSNPDLLRLMKDVGWQTPVLIRESLEWVALKNAGRESAAQDQQRLLQSWVQAWSGAGGKGRAAEQSLEQQAESLSGVYEAGFLRSRPARNTLDQLSRQFKQPQMGLQDVGVFSWSEPKGELRVVNLKLVGSNPASALQLRQYWRKTGNGWKIFSEDILR